ncbi:hypothetical protein ACQ4PT_012690 [Festuca glaucescens]
MAGTTMLSLVFVGSVEAGTWASAVVGGALAAAVNTVEHGGQMGTLSEFYRKVQEDIEANLAEPPSSTSRIRPPTGKWAEKLSGSPAETKKTTRIYWAVLRSPPNVTSPRAHNTESHTRSAPTPLRNTAAATFSKLNPSPGESRRRSSCLPRDGKEAMQPGGEGGGLHGCTAQDHPPAAVRLGEDASPHSASQLSAIVSVDSEERKQKQQEPAANLPEGPLVEILARVPYRSLCRFKCVSKPWLALCSSRDIRKRSPQTLSGFFYKDISGLHFRNLSGRGPPMVDPSLSFLRGRYEHIFVEQCGDGLLLCSCWNMETKSDYLVCSPATEEWNVLPPLELPAQVFGHVLHFKPIAYLGFDAAIPSRISVFVPITNGLDDSGKVAFYSSEVGQWSYVQSKWASGPLVDHSRKTRVFLNGTIHLTTIDKWMLTVDIKGKVWREIKMPGYPGTEIVYLGQSQGRLYAWQIDNHLCHQLYIWVLEDYGTGKWTLKHSISVLELFGRHCRKDGSSYVMFAVHPDCNVIFLTDMEKMTLSYN